MTLNTGFRRAATCALTMAAVAAAAHCAAAAGPMRPPPLGRATPLGLVLLRAPSLRRSLLARRAHTDGQKRHWRFPNIVAQVFHIEEPSFPHTSPMYSWLDLYTSPAETDDLDPSALRQAEIDRATNLDAEAEARALYYSVDENFGMCGQALMTREEFEDALNYEPGLCRADAGAHPCAEAGYLNFQGRTTHEIPYIVSCELDMYTRFDFWTMHN